MICGFLKFHHFYFLIRFAEFHTIQGSRPNTKLFNQEISWWASNESTPYLCELLQNTVQTEIFTFLFLRNDNVFRRQLSLLFLPLPNLPFGNSEQSLFLPKLVLSFTCLSSNNRFVTLLFLIFLDFLTRVGRLPILSTKMYTIHRFIAIARHGMNR